MTTQTNTRHPVGKRYIDVLGSRMAYVETGEGDPIVFLHGNPSSSYLWRNILPFCSPFGRCLAPDLIGMGDSDKLADTGPGRYTFAEQRRYLDAWFDAMGLTQNVTLVVHDWGSALGFDWARRHPEAVKGIAYMEAIVADNRWDAWPQPVAEMFRAFRTPAGEEMVLQNNVMIERAVPAGVLRKLDDDEMAEYRRPFAYPGEGRRPTLAFASQLPIEGTPADIVEIVSAYRAWLGSTEIPKLFVNAEPGSMNVAHRDLCRTFPNQHEVTVKGLHFIQEDSPEEIGLAIAKWYESL
ncbi:haloalkane dehalogenase [Burkholderia pseudomallei]|nr:haloalkane dehalogenase [Burkholderia pseudomallei]ARM04477.1 haloalkane dehalogenase [Burkholderia pseudomallei]